MIEPGRYRSQPQKTCSWGGDRQFSSIANLSKSDFLSLIVISPAFWEGCCCESCGKSVTAEVSGVGRLTGIQRKSNLQRIDKCSVVRYVKCLMLVWTESKACLNHMVHLLFRRSDFNALAITRSFARAFSCTMVRLLYSGASSSSSSFSNMP